VDDAPIAPLNQIEDELYESTVFEIIGHNLEFVGLCPECSKKINNVDPKKSSVMKHVS
jgi:Fur family ferric uptake transcriptional regulator